MPSGWGWQLQSFPKNLLGFPSATDADLDRAKQVVLFAKSLIPEMPSAIVGYSLRVSYMRKLLALDDCYVIPAKSLRCYPIFPSVLDGTGDEDPFVVCLAEEQQGRVGSFVRLGVEYFLPLEEAGKSLKTALAQRDTEEVARCLRRVSGSIRSHTTDMDRKYDNNYERIQRARHDFWQRYQDAHEDVRRVDETATSSESEQAITVMMRCVAAVVRDTARNPDYLPQVCSYETDRSMVMTADGAFLSQCEEVLALLKTAPVADLALDPSVKELWGVCLDSPLAAFLRPVLQSVLPAPVANPMRDDDKFLALPSLRESVFVFDTRNWRALELDPRSHPFIFDSSDPSLVGYFPLPEASFSADLAAVIGFDPSLLDLRRSAITGSAVAFALHPNNKPGGVLVADYLLQRRCGANWFYTRTQETFVHVRERKVREDFTIAAEFEIRHCQSHWSKPPPHEHKPTTLKHGYDVDIAVFSKNAEEFDAIVDNHYQAIRRMFPHSVLEKVERQKGHGWQIVTLDYEEFIRLPPIEFFPSTISAICSHHVAPVRACFTAAYQEEGRPARVLATSSALRSYHKGALDWFNYFASKKSFPQSILAKYLSRGYHFSCFVPEPIRAEVTQFLLRHPDWMVETPIEIIGEKSNVCQYNRWKQLKATGVDEWKIL
jgi:hypothetical protein